MLLGNVCQAALHKPSSLVLVVGFTAAGSAAVQVHVGGFHCIASPVGPDRRVVGVRRVVVEGYRLSVRVVGGRRVR
jgi:hypothetical protein